MTSLVQAVKYSSPVAGLYRNLLNIKCRPVEAFIFVATTGRSGSKSLTRILEAADNAVCFHEPYPIMYSDFPEGADKKSYFDRLFHKQKIINILREAAGHRYYAETNHQFIKNYFAQSEAYFGKRLRIIHMYRDPVEVAISLHSMDTIPGKTPTGKLFTLDPLHNDNLIRIGDLLTDNHGFGHDFFRCLWYWYEIEARVKKSKADFPDLVWAELATEDLNDKSALERMFGQLGVDYNTEKLNRVAGARENTQKQRGNKPSVLPEAREMAASLLEKMEERYGKRFWR